MLGKFGIYTILIFMLIIFCSYMAYIYNLTKKKQQFTLTIFFILFYFAIIVFRPTYLSDTLVYSNTYNQISAHEYYPFSFKREQTTKFEYLFIYLIQLSKIIFDNFDFFNILVTLLMLGAFAYSTKIIVEEFTKTSYNFPLFLMLFFPYYGLYYNAVVLRGGLALAFTYCAFSLFICKRKLVVPFLCELLGFLFQRMGIIGWSLPFFFHLIPSIKSRIKYYFWLIIIGGIWILEYRFMFLLKLFRLSISYIASIIPALSDYVNYLAYDYQEGILFVITQFAFFCNGFFIIKYIDFSNKKIKKIMNIYLLGLTFMAFGMRFKFISRICDFFLFTNVPLNYIVLEQKNTLKLKIPFLIIFFHMVLYTVCVVRAITYTY